VCKVGTDMARRGVTVLSMIYALTTAKNALLFLSLGPRIPSVAPKVRGGAYVPLRTKERSPDRKAGMRRGAEGVKKLASERQ